MHFFPEHTDSHQGALLNPGMLLYVASSAPPYRGAW
jgi:hypothetical protein